MGKAISYSLTVLFSAIYLLVAYQYAQTFPSLWTKDAAGMGVWGIVVAGIACAGHWIMVRKNPTAVTTNSEIRKEIAQTQEVVRAANKTDDNCSYCNWHRRKCDQTCGECGIIL